MRDILFRSKRVDNGEWVEGSLVVSQDRINYGKCYMTSSVCDFSYGDNGDRIRLGCFVEVIPETVGQFTGLRDKNGKRIFEGDIVDVEYDIQYVGVAAERIGLFEVVFHDGCFMKEKNGGGLFHFIKSDKCQVIGNIHDNPELLDEV